MARNLAQPADFEAAAEMIEPGAIPEAGPRLRAGGLHVHIHQIGHNQDEFIEFARRELLPDV